MRSIKHQKPRQCPISLSVADPALRATFVSGLGPRRCVSSYRGQSRRPICDTHQRSTRKQGMWGCMANRIFLRLFLPQKRAVRSMANNCWHLGFLVRYGKMICFQCFFVEVCRPRFCWGQWPCSNYGTPAAGRRAPSGPWALLSRQGSSG